MDGTDQLSNGIPQFREISKDDCGQMRIRHHIEVVQIAGAPDIVRCYVVPEDIPGDTNVSVEVLQRTLKAEEKRRGGTLPNILTVQLDNCAGTNKNTYLFSYLSLLVERGVFDVIYVSFLPVGHTHNGPDRIASRISNAVRRTNIHSEAAFVDIIAGSHTPRPIVEVIDKVADFKKLVNPTAQPAFTGGLARRLSGIGLLRPCTVCQFKDFISSTSNLHFRIAMDTTSFPHRACIQDKQTIDVPDWSPVEYPWSARVYDDDQHVGALSWLDNLRCAPSVPIPETRQVELLKFLSGCAWRLKPEDLQPLVDKVNHMAAQRISLPCHWEDGGMFNNEQSDDDHEEEEEEEEEEESLQLARDHNCIILNQNELAARRGLPLTNMVEVDDFIAYRPVYTDDIPLAKRKPHYVGKVSSVSVLTV